MTRSAPYDVSSHPSHGGHGHQESTDPKSIAAGRLWATGVATAVVAALVAVVATLFVRSVLDVPLFAPREAGVWGDATTGYLAAWAAAGAFVATGLLHLLLVTVVRPRAFFGWIAGLVTVSFALLPFTTNAALAPKAATAAVFLAIGGSITGLLSATAQSMAPAESRDTW
jgi:hypothetical protein